MEDREREPSREEEDAREMPEDEGIPDLDPALPAKEITGDAQEGLVVPRDEPRALDEPGTSAEEQREGQSLDERLEREDPDVPPSPRQEPGRLVEEGWGLTDHEKDEVAESVPATEGLTAEEEAVQVQDEAPGGTEEPDSYVQEDEG